MHRSEAYDMVRCLHCGAEISIARDRTYVLGDDDALCFECAVDRGGAYDDVADCWTRAPALDGLPLQAPEQR